jgi:hypothetical protein
MLKASIANFSKLQNVPKVGNCNRSAGGHPPAGRSGAGRSGAGQSEAGRSGAGRRGRLQGIRHGGSGRALIPVHSAISVRLIEEISFSSTSLPMTSNCDPLAEGTGSVQPDLKSEPQNNESSLVTRDNNQIPSQDATSPSTRHFRFLSSPLLKSSPSCPHPLSPPLENITTPSTTNIRGVNSMIRGTLNR